jgi:hypothetical protein
VKIIAYHPWNMRGYSGDMLSLDLMRLKNMRGDTEGLCEMRNELAMTQGEPL